MPDYLGAALVLAHHHHHHHTHTLMTNVNHAVSTAAADTTPGLMHTIAIGLAIIVALRIVVWLFSHRKQNRQ